MTWLLGYCVVVTVVTHVFALVWAWNSDDVRLLRCRLGHHRWERETEWTEVCHRCWTSRVARADHNCQADPRCDGLYVCSRDETRDAPKQARPVRP